MAGDENPFEWTLCHRTMPVPASRAYKPSKVSTYTMPYAAAGVDTISRVPRSRSQRTAARFDTGDPDVPVPAAGRPGALSLMPSPRNPSAGRGNAGVGTGVRASKDTESNAALLHAIASPLDRTRELIPTRENSHPALDRFQT